MYEFGLPQKECGSAFLLSSLCSYVSFFSLCGFISFSPYVIPNSLHHLSYPQSKRTAPLICKFSKRNTLMYEFGLPQKECGSAFFFVLIMQLRLFLFLCESQCCLTALLACWVACFFACLRKSFNFLMSSSCFTC